MTHPLDALVYLDEFKALPTRCRNIILREGVTTVKDLLDTPEGEIRGWRSVKVDDIIAIENFLNFLRRQVRIEVRLYEKCLHCHLFVERHDPYEGQDDVTRFLHLSRGDDADERFEDHEPTPSGMVANLDTWRVFGPSAMRERFVTKDRV